MGMNKLNKLKEVIQEANPSILELKFGCEVLYNNRAWYVLRRMDYDNLFIETFEGGYPKVLLVSIEEQQFNKSFKILGRPIQLADVLIAIDKKYPEPYQEIKVSERFYYFDNSDSPGWNLTQDLDHQSEEVIDFLYDILVN